MKTKIIRICQEGTIYTDREIRIEVPEDFDGTKLDEGTVEELFYEENKDTGDCDWCNGDPDDYYEPYIIEEDDGIAVNMSLERFLKCTEGADSEVKS